MSGRFRDFIGNCAVVASLVLLGSTACAAEDIEWKDVVAWDHSWDASDATTYVDDGKNYNIPEAVRVDTIPDPSGNLIMSRDQGFRMKLLGLPPLPGTLFQTSNAMFSGRPSWFSDTVVPHDPGKPGYYYSIQSTLSPVQDPWNAPDTFFKWPQPWWGAVLVRGVGPFKGHNQAYIDGNPGMVTISRSPKGTVMIRSWTANDTFGPSIDSGAPYEEQTALVMWLANGKESWLEVNYRSADGRLITERVLGAIGSKNMDDFHSGGSHTNYTSVIGIAKGVPTAAQTNAIRNWAAPFIPAPDPVEATVAEPG